MSWSPFFLRRIEVCVIFAFALLHLNNGMPTSETKIADDWRKLIDDDVYEYYREKSRKRMSNLFEGDIAGIDVEGMMMGNLTASLAQNAILQKDQLWPNGIVIFAMAGSFLPEEERIITGALNDIASKTCVKFKKRDWETSYILFGNNHSGCYSYIGRTGRLQDLNLVSGCITLFGEVQHEVMHALGFNHEQTRTDRDQYITINWENISEDEKHNFEKYDGNRQGHPYDYSSIMHYGWNDFAIDEDKPTIIPKSGKKERIGNRKVMSPLDVKKINMLYGCTKSLTRQASPSKWSLRNQGGPRHPVQRPNRQGSHSFWSSSSSRIEPSSFSLFPDLPEAGAIDQGLLCPSNKPTSRQADNCDSDVDCQNSQHGPICCSFCSDDNCNFCLRTGSNINLQ